ncbi:MAG: alpha-L-rhamnosidase, partial [Verrucomicrobia bacterium]
YLSAQGLVDPWLNGRRVTEDLFVPGWPDYTRRVFYVAYDVTEEMRVGENALGIVLGDGWYSGTMLRDQQAGPTPRVSAWIELYSADGGRRRVFLDGGARVAQGPIVLQGIYAGETYDARREQPDWATPGGAASWEWSNVVIEPTPPVAVTARFSPPVRRIEEIRPVAHRRAGPTVHRFDLGQNMVGWIRLKVRAAPGTEVIIRFAEMLEADGSLHLRNLRSAAATARYIARGDPQGEVWEPHFTFFGFRHVEVSGLETLPEDAVTGIVVHTDLRRIGSFECSAPLLNQLYRNTLWGQKGNFLELPTDCPQRDERLGWTGDAQVFCHTANYNLESYAFYRQWLRTLRDSFVDGPEGGFPSVAPNTGFIIGAAGWADAGVIVPWVVYLHSGDRRVLEESFDAARRWVDIMRAQAPDGIRRSRKAYGDWLAPGAPKPGEAPTPYVLIATAFYAHSADLVARMADVLGEVEQARHYRALFEEVRRAFQREFIAADGAIVSDEQTAYVLALAFDLVDEARRPAMVKHLESAIAAKDDHLATGFLGTYLLAPTLTKVGLTDLAYRIVQQETYPGWLFSVKNGATTIWERWDSWTPEQGFHPEGMNSFNHYAYGAIVGWFYHTVAGIRPDPRQPGWRRFILAPEPGGGLTFARASLETPYGRVASYWKVEAGGWSWEVEVPANTSAEVHLPVETAEDVVADGRDLLSAQGVSDVREADGRVAFRLDSGAYRFRVRAP